MVTIKDLTINCESKLVDALEVIEKGQSQIVFVEDNQNKVIGTISDGDIRRGLLQGKSLSAKSTEFMNTNFQYIKDSEMESKAFEIMKEKKIKQIPVLDINGKLVKVIFPRDLKPQINLPNSIIIMAGGKGSRLMPHTSNCPKPMLRIGEKPMIEIIINKCIEFGFSKFFISVNYLKEQIVDYFKDGSHLNIEINYLEENEPLGTAGSLSLLPRNLSHPFIVMNGDILTQINLNKLINYHNKNSSTATVCAREEKYQCQFGVIKTKGINLDSFEEKPIISHLVNAGVYVLNPNTLNFLNKQEFKDMPDLLEKLKREDKKVIVYPIHEYWIDIGRYETYQKAEKEWNN